MSENQNKMLWGKSTWILLHTLAAQIKDSEYQRLKVELFSIVRQICANLPCPDCAKHAREFIGIDRVETIPTKVLFNSMLHQFHNSVNHRIGKRKVGIQVLHEYNTYNLGIALQNFLTFYAKRYNGTLSAGIVSTEIIRRRVAITTHEWLKKHWGCFN